MTTVTPIPDEARAHLSAADPVMAELVGRLGAIEYTVDSDLWRALVGSIVGQQLSVAAATTIRARIAALDPVRFPTPETLLDLPDDTLRRCGLSRPKIAYLRDASRRWIAGEVRPTELTGLSDDEVIDTLVAIKGIGRWTAEMVLLFSLGRPDVLAVDDLGIRSAVQRAYGLDARPDRAEVARIGAPWKPFRSYASLYLWRSLKA
jgi:DNA-3-methyladenine glycosylase II